MDTLELLRLATRAPSADNSQPWAFTQHGNALTCRYAHPGNFRDPFGASGHASLLAAGTLHENLDLITDGQVESRLDSRHEDIPWQLNIRPAGVSIPSPELCRKIESRHTNRHPFDKRAPGQLPDCQASPGVRIVTCTESARIHALGDALQLCSRARFNQPELHEWLFTSLRWNDEEIAAGDGLDINTLHLPPGGQHFMRWIKPWHRMEMLNRLGIDRIMSIADTVMVRQAPVVIALCGSNEAQDIWNAGRTLQRLWLALNDAGLAVHPYYAVTDLGNRRRAGRLLPGWEASVLRGEEICAEALGLAQGEQVHMLLRAGFARHAAVRAKRRPPQRFLSPGSGR
ncbi:hypothetical protein [Zoogloea sp.]|uniref:hypothetical protein n=1 Tax=Zoogloea sp. TaxID=49181 RepID=UPI0014169BD1|nr:MAG: hypothetical protein F9K15_08645 [Zoogloea sp.]